ncbi:hypothetical protein WICPIJ_007392 [Wickerhamomyces pijperi]|uniref:Uncharacterized protein n=1 Tax=Wickerhamomyces pijperi TaxID=599730 RepID=A0A9P8TKI0_WICPI|nr:hypothetical protein WICPIJ_007392 [Wickerhamomyces pijperi]
MLGSHCNVVQLTALKPHKKVPVYHLDVVDLDLDLSELSERSRSVHSDHVVLNHEQLIILEDLDLPDIVAKLEQIHGRRRQIHQLLVNRSDQHHIALAQGHVVPDTVLDEEHQFESKLCHFINRSL